MLFADVVRSMDLAVALDIERLRDVITALVTRLTTVARRYDGGTVEYTGDGVMAIFGAPVALEDHAFRACLAALAIQEEAQRLAAEVQRRDGVVLQLRVGLNSGRVIAGEVGAGWLGYRATGEHIGLAQRMEAAAPPGGVMLSESTARLVEHTVVLAESESVHIKGADEPVRARRLLGMNPHGPLVGRTEASLVGRRCEMSTLDAAQEVAVDRRGIVVNVVGPPGIGKSRLVRESATLAAGRGMEVSWGFCESHARDVPFHAVSGLLRAVFDLADLDTRAAREKLRQQTPDADPQDLLLLDDLLGIADPNMSPPQLDPDTRRNRLTSLIEARALARSAPALFVIEDVHWIDAVSESMLADFLAVIPHTASVVLITSRPEYEGSLLRVNGAQRIKLDVLADSDIFALLGELLGPDPSVGELAMAISARAAGNPFFAEEMVREMVQSGVLVGEHSRYRCVADIAEVNVPATVHAAIGARIDRLSAPARRTLNAASVIGARFDAELLGALGVDAAYEELLGAELIDRPGRTPNVKYAFRHPLIRAVTYETQLKSDRAELHRRLAAAIHERAPDSLEENAALIAEHLEAAGELIAAYDWRMRAGAWSTNRDLDAARLSWERARRIADRLPEDSATQPGPPAADADVLSKRIAPRTMLCATDIQARAVQESRTRFAELQELCAEAGDNASLAIAMTAVATEALYSGRAREAAQLSSHQMPLLESMADHTPLMGLSAIAFCNWLGVLDFDEILRWSQSVADMAAGDPAKGAGYGIESPLAIALAWRGTAGWCRSRPGWRRDLHNAVAMARTTNAETFSGAIAWSYGIAMQYGVLRVDDVLLRASEDAVQTAHSASSDRAMGLAGYTLAVALLNQDDADNRRRGLDLMDRTRELWLQKRAVFLVPVTHVWTAWETARRGDRDGAITTMRAAVGDLRRVYPFYGVWGTGVLVQTLLERRNSDDLSEAREEIDRLTSLAATHDSTMVEIMVLRLRALLAGARGDAGYADLVSRYRAAAGSLGFEGHIAWADAMADGAS